ncbi:alpha-amylase family glycosyl hydrolase [Mesomycoplasma molare]|uniref:Alpha-amylase family glycosyl hydrolase n=1 Tax=Mesomycoplasma molare TaxID=171288 RepID=A0ABY5TYA4_9BACT|nr:alpha-amylase family glycosyl hydrolase [Mesomycoplasma molare]UWD34506.1 alpha-amylase family glycosyl hydrolase [Mesomycoplasma molare]
MKKNYYELLTNRFYDSNSSGVGDYLGVALKEEYFNNLEIDELIIPSFLDNYSEIKDKKFIKHHYGSIEDLKNMIMFFHKKRKKVNMIFDFKKSDLYFKNLKNYEIISNLEDNYPLENINNTFSFFVDSEVTKIIDLKWLRSEKKDNFLKIIEIYLSLGIDGIVFKNILYTNEPNLKFDTNSHIIMNNLIEKIKYLDNKIKLYGVLDFSFFKHYQKNNFKKFKFDDFFFDFYSNYWIEKKFDNEFNKKYSVIRNWVFIRKMLLYKENYAFILNNEQYGRISSRLAENREDINLFKKMLFAIFILNNKNDYFFQGDEIGQENIHFLSQEDLGEDLFSYKKRLLEEKGINKENFFANRSKLSKNNNMTSFAWNSEKGMGFNKQEKNYFKKPIEFKSNNLTKNFKDPNSLFNWIKELLYFKKMFFEESEKIKCTKINLNFPNLSVLKYKIIFSKCEFLIFINLSKKTKKIYVNRNKFELKINSLKDKIEDKSILEISKYQVLLFQKK